MGKILLSVIGIVLLLGGIIFLQGEKTYDAIVYKSPTCGCCVKYIPYVEGNGLSVKAISTTKMDDVRKNHGVPDNFDSCHTMVIGDYFIEGHVPMEAVEKLLNDLPDLDGISLPNMPSGSPGMPGIKRGDFVIYGIKNGETSEFMRI